MQIKTSTYVMLLLLMTVLSVAASGCGVKPEANAPAASGGILDLSGRDFNTGEPVVLAGEWEFYWKSFIAPGRFNDPAAREKRTFRLLPNKWNRYSVDGKELPAYGYATYRLIVNLPAETGMNNTVFGTVAAKNNPVEALGFKLGLINTAYVMYVNGRKMVECGKTGTSVENTSPGTIPLIIQYNAGDPRLEIVLHVSNYHYHVGGPWEPIMLGSFASVSRMRERNIALTLFLAGSIFIMALYHCGLFITRRKDRSTLYFGLLCVVVSVLTFTMGDRLLRLVFPAMGWDLMVRMQFLMLYLSPLMLLLFVRSLYPGEFALPVIAVFAAITVVLEIFVAATAAEVYSVTLMYYFVLVAVGLLYCLWVIILAMRRKREGAVVFLSGFAFAVIAVAHDIAASYGKWILFYIDLLDFGLFAFIFSQAYLLSRRFSNSVTSAENLSEELKRKNEELDRDLLQRRRIEEELARIRNLLGSIFDSLPSMLISVDREGVVTQWNRVAERNTGVSAYAAVGRRFDVSLPFGADLRDTLDSVLFSGSAGDLDIEHAQGDEKRHYAVSISPLIYGGVAGAVIRIDDVTDIRIKDEQLLQAQKMETVGNLAGGLAHDFNNILLGIIGSVSLIKAMLAEGNARGEQIREMIEIIENASSRAANLVRQLLTLSRRHELSLESVDLNETIRHVVMICENTFDKSIHIRILYAQASAMVKADPVQMEQVVLNLCVNAAHAMTFMRKNGEPYGGFLSISIEKAVPDDNFRMLHPGAVEPEYWMITHRDTGVGIDEQILPKIFDPFFTTKKKSSGTGLGLSTAYMIVRQHHGFIDVESEPGRGSVFRVYLPAIENAGRETEKSSMSEVEKGSGLVLVIDDDEVARRTAAGMLMQCGYEVITASDGVDGLELFGQYKDRVRAVLLDMIMPRLSGKEAFIALRAMDPGVKILFTSGFKNDGRVAEVIRMGVNGFIQKPYVMNDIARKMKEVIGV